MVSDAPDFAKGYSQSELAVDLCVNVLVRRVRHACFAAPRRSGRGRKAVGQVASKHPSEGYKARPDRALRTAVCNAGRVESLVLQGRIIIAVQCVCICCLGVCE
jgi:hypothetical protein